MPKKLDKLLDAVSEWFGSTNFLLLFTVLTVLWTVLGFIGLDPQFNFYTVFLSILAIYMTNFIERTTTKVFDFMVRILKVIEKDSEDALKRSRATDRKLNKLFKRLDQMQELSDNKRR